MEPTDLSDVARLASTSKCELLARYEDIVAAVIAEYVRIKSFPALAAATIDPDQPLLSKLTFGHVEYLVDIEKATEHALKDRPDLQRSWFQLAFSEPVTASKKKQLFLRCGRIYSARNLAPWRYWQRDRYAHRRKP